MSSTKFGHLALPGTLAAAFAAVSWLLYGGYLTDDSYIHFVYARNFAEGAGMAFNPGEPSYGSTSPLWVLVLAFGTWLGGSTPAVAQIVSLTSSAACVLAVWLLARQVGTSPAARLLPPLALAIDPWFQRWSVSGMEGGFAALIVVLGFAAAFVARPERGGLVTVAGVILGLGVLARPEVALLVGLIGLLFLLTGRLADAVKFGVGAALPLGAWLTFALLHFGTIVPNSFVVKLRQTGSPWESAFDAIAIMGASTMVPLLVLGASLVAALTMRRQRQLSIPAMLPWLVPLVWTLGAIAQYSYRGVNVASRYMTLYTPLLLLCAAWWLSRWSPAAVLPRGDARRVGLATVVLLALVVGQPAAIGFMTWRSVKVAERSYSDNHHAIAEWLDRQMAREDTIATYDVGIIAYRTRRTIVDLAGLTDTLPTRERRQSMEAKVLESHPNYVVMQGKSPGEFVQRTPALSPFLEQIYFTEMYWGPGPQQMDVFTIYRGRW